MCFEAGVASAPTPHHLRHAAPASPPSPYVRKPFCLDLGMPSPLGRSARPSPRLIQASLLTLLALVMGPTFADHDLACRNTPGVDLAYAAHRFEAGDNSAVFEVLPPEQLLPGPGWQLFLNQDNPLQSFMYPPQWRPSIVPADAMAGDAGVRLDAPDGRASLEVFLDGVSFFSPRGQVALEDVASFGLAQVLGTVSFQVLCSDNAIAPALASVGVQNLFAAVSTPSHHAVVKVTSFTSGGMEPSYFFLVYAGPKGDFENLVRFVFGPVVASFPKGGGGGTCTCELGEPDRDGDGTCDRCDDYPDDPNRQ